MVQVPNIIKKAQTIKFELFNIIALLKFNKRCAIL